MTQGSESSGNRRPIGICGSGLIDTLAELFLTGILDERGKVKVELAEKNPRIRQSDAGGEYVLAWADETQSVSISVVTVDEVIARIEEVEATQVQAMAQRLFDPHRIAVTLLGRLDGIKLGRARLVC